MAPDRDDTSRRPRRHAGRRTPPHGAATAPTRTPKAERREELLDAATDAIRRHGDRVSMEDLAAEAGVTKPILYRHFGDRNGLIAALGDRFSGALLAELQAALTAHPDDPHRTLVDAIDVFLAFVERDTEVYRFLVQRMAPEQRETVEALDTFLTRVSQEVALVLGEQMRAVGRDSGGAEPIAHGIVGFVYAAGDWWLEHRTMPRARLVEYLAGVLWSGLEIREENR